MSPPSIRVRPATPDDIATLARYRAAMFTDMGSLPLHLADDLVERSARYLRRAIPAGEYLGWLAEPEAAEGSVVGSAGLQLRRILPRPVPGSAGIVLVEGREAIVLNVYTEPPWRRRGVARRLMEAVIAWAREGPVDSLVLHASDEGRALYEALGFVQTNEMRYMGHLERRSE